MNGKSQASDPGAATIEALGARLRAAVEKEGGGALESAAEWGALEPTGWRSPAGGKALVVTFRERDAGRPLATYRLVPWQALFEADAGREMPLLARPPLTVTGEALVFESIEPPERDARAAALREKVSRAVAEAIDLEGNERALDEPLGAPVPHDLQVMAATVHRHHVTLEVALPGSRLPPDPDADLRKLAPGRMIRLSLVPEQGRVRSHWIAPDAAARAKRAAAPGAGEPLPPPPGGDRRTTPFGDYRPKRTPDTVRDYRPAIGARLSELPPADLGALPALIARLAEEKRRAKEAPGSFEDGNVILGADREEYRPSDDELLESETGDRIARVVAAAAPADLARVLEGAGIEASAIEYGKIAVRHADVMGSGRFFYASAPVATRIALRGR